MMVKPILGELMEFVDSKYTLVTVSAKRARRIMEKDDMLYDNPVSMALNEIVNGEVTWERMIPEPIEDEVEDVK